MEVLRSSYRVDRRTVLKATAADEVLGALRTVLEQLAAEDEASEVRSGANEERSQ